MVGVWVSAMQTHCLIIHWWRTACITTCHNGRLVALQTLSVINLSTSICLPNFASFPLTLPLSPAATATATASTDNVCLPICVCVCDPAESCFWGWCPDFADCQQPQHEARPVTSGPGASPLANLPLILLGSTSQVGSSPVNMCGCVIVVTAHSGAKAIVLCLL